MGEAGGIFRQLAEGKYLGKLLLDPQINAILDDVRRPGFQNDLA